MPIRLALLNRFIGGWTAYFALAETPSVFDELDEWLRRRLRQVRWKEWKRSAARRRNLRAPAVSRRLAGPSVGATAAKATGGYAGSAPLPGRCPTATGPTSVWCRSANGLVASGSLANRRMRTRTSGGVGGGG